MDIVYIANSRLPSKRANAIQVVKTCEALSAEGCNVTLLIPARDENRFHSDEDVWTYFGVKNPFKIVRLPVMDYKILNKIGLNKLWFFLLTNSFANATTNYLRRNSDSQTVVYTRHDPSAKKIVSSGIDVPVVYEAHIYSKSKSHRILGADGVVGITKSLVKDYSDDLGCQTMAIPDGVDLKQIDSSPPKLMARNKLNISSKEKIILYTGQLYTWKGVPTLLSAARLLPHYRFIIVGGYGKYLENIQKGAPKNVSFVGHKDHSQIPTYLSAADVLVIPNTKEKISREYTSPLKLFEYMAAERPIVVSDLPSMREVLDDDSAFFFESENSTDLAAKIQEALESNSSAKTRLAKKKVLEYTWDKRAEKIITFLQQIRKTR